MNRKQLDESFPTIVRYTGLLLTLVLVAGTFLGYGTELAAGYVAAAGMVLYKTVKGAAENGPVTPR